MTINHFFEGHVAFNVQDGMPVIHDWRWALAGKLRFTAGLQGKCFSIYPEVSWQRLMIELSAIPMTDLKGCAIRRAVIGSVEDVRVMEDNRLGLPLPRNDPREDVMLAVGVGDHIEIWFESAWLEFMKNYKLA